VIKSTHWPSDRSTDPTKKASALAMIPTSVEQRLTTESESNIDKLLADRDHVFLVDWREEDDAIVGYCESSL
jgi:hypothetical protein